MSIGRFGRNWNDGQIGFGSESYSDAINAGYSASEINDFINSGSMRAGRRATDMASAGATAQRQAASNYQAQVNAANAKNAAYESRINDYQNQINSFNAERSGYQSRISDFTNQVSNLSNQYQSALTQSQEYQREASDWQDQFKDKSAEYEVARGEADRYRNEAVGQQLRAMKSGATTGGANSTTQRGGLAGGRSQYQRGSNDDIDVEKNISAESGALSNKGAAVKKMNTSQRRQTAPQGRPNQGLASGSTNGYYASRFG